MEKLKLISHTLCPYVQRAAIALSEKNVEFERVDIDLGNKPDWFLKISPLGKVPLLVVSNDNGENVIFESGVILEYLDETLNPKLHPEDALTRAQHRSWNEFNSSVLADIWTLYVTTDAETFEKKSAIITEKFSHIENELSKRSEPLFFSGANFSLVDAVFAPVFRYIDLFETKADLHLLDEYKHIKQWRDILRNRPSVISAVAEDYGQKLKEFIIKKDSILAQKFKL